MSGAELVFLVFALLAVAAAVLVVIASEPRRILAGYAGLAGALAVIFVLLQAPVVAVAHLLVGIAALGSAFPGASRLTTPTGKVGRTALSLGGLALAVIAFVLFGTLARQYVSYGADLDPDRGFGGFESVGPELFGRHAIAVDVVGLMLLCAVMAVVLARRGPASPNDGEVGG